MSQTNQNFWKPGDQILIREISKGKTWTARPVTIVEDTNDRLVFYMAPGTIFKHPRCLDSDEVPQHLLAEDWRLVDTIWYGGGALYISKPGEPYMIIGFRNDDNTQFQRWYINLQDPLIRTNLGFDYLDMELDIEIDKDLSKWHWKDDEKFNKLVEKSIIPKAKAANLQAVGKRVAEEIVEKRSVLEPWKNWVPPSSFMIPHVPKNWDKID